MLDHLHSTKWGAQHYVRHPWPVTPFQLMYRRRQNWKMAFRILEASSRLPSKWRGTWENHSEKLTGAPELNWKGQEMVHDSPKKLNSWASWDCLSLRMTAEGAASASRAWWGQSCWDFAKGWVHIKQVAGWFWKDLAQEACLRVSWPNRKRLGGTCHQMHVYHLNQRMGKKGPPSKGGGVSKISPKWAHKKNKRGSLWISAHRELQYQVATSLTEFVSCGCHKKLGGLKQPKCILSQFWSHKFNLKVSAGPRSSQKLWGECVLASSSFWWL